MIVFKNFNLYRLLSQQVAPVCLGGEQRGSNAFLNFFESIANWVAGLILRSQSFPRLWSQSLCVERKHQNSKQWPKWPRSRSPLKVSIYLASFRSKLHCPFRITRKQRFSCLFWMYCQTIPSETFLEHLCLNYDRRALAHQIEQFDYIRITHPHATAAGGRADLVLVFGAMNVDEAVACIGILLVQSVEP